MCRRLSWGLCGAWFFAASAALATPIEGGVRLQWDDCSGPNTKTFACDTNAGTRTLVASYCAPPGVTQLTGVELIIDIQSSAPSLPDWWKFKVSGSCRETALTMALAAPADGGCADYWNGFASGGVASYTFGPSPDRARMVALAAIDPGLAGALVAGERYFAVRFGISNVRTTGSPSCAGCGTPVAIGISQLNLVQPLGIGDYWLSAPCPGVANVAGDVTNGRAVFWNGGNSAPTLLGGLGVTSVCHRWTW